MKRLLRLAVAIALAGTAQPAWAHEAIPPRDFPGPRYYVIPGGDLPATPANARHDVALARRALQGCVAAKTAAADYHAARSALQAKRYRVAMAASRNVVDDCTR